ncbi:aldehyde dehydrogenase (NAD+) [Kineothrix alysoides]|uniref:Aldehyde dehydrogenase n=1 Tax=Kineothrix alysoides TaxID=1469948 RepID=A0A4R1QST1_9FIRM|nr:aldehyde dehydrogenase [Kineothrix alysoides]TCL56956.1 aldehyde dehydrogenase (NAD+) [Kineothrix alysoides]
MDRDITKIMKMQRTFYETGVTKQYKFRMRALERLEKALEEYEEELKLALKADLNKSSSESYMAEIGLTKSELSYVKKHLRLWMEPKKVPTPIAQFPADSFILPEPYGVVLIMAPWNYPVLLCLEPLIDAIAAGNCAVLKPSAYAPAVSAALKKMLKGIYPDKFVAVVEGGREENAELLEQRFDYIFFTGGVAVGRTVLEKAAKYLTPVTLELGGKSPCIVDKTANVEMAAKRIAFGKILNAGQTCVAPDYLLVHKDIKEELLKGICAEWEKMLGEKPLENPNYPKIINQKHFERLLHLTEGEKIITGGIYKTQTRQIAPTILDGVTPDSVVMKEEIFGPILPVLAFETKDEIKDIVLSFEKPLAFYLFTEDKDMVQWALGTFSFGGGCINDTMVHLASSHLPFGGVGFSGMGSYHGKVGFETFSHRKSVLKSGYHPDVPLRYHPYSDVKDKAIRLFLK